MNKRVFLLFAIFVLSAGGTFFLLKPNPKARAEKALLHLKQNNFSASEAALKSLASLSVDYPESLYRGYLEQMRGRFDVSDSALQIAYNEAKKSGNQKMMAEILMARSANAYFEKRDSDLFSHLEFAQRISSRPGFTFFEGLQNYIKHDYAEALRLWSNYSSADVGEWMALSLERLFPQIWRKLHMAHCLIEKGEIPTGREILEKESHALSDDPEVGHLAALFLGLSYIKDTHKIPFDQRGSYYNMACFYFEHAQVGERYYREKNRVIAHVEETAKNLLLPHLDSDKRKWGFDFVHTLQIWKAHGSIARLTDHLAAKLVEQKEEDSARFCAAIRNEFLGTPFHDQLTEKLLATLASALQKGESDDLFELWALVESLSSNPKMTAKEIASLTSDEIFETIKKDNLSLIRTRNYIAFWEALGRNASEREILARDLLFHAKLFWHSEKQEKKGLRLMEIALKMSNCSPFIEKEITSFLTNLYVQAENSNMIRRLTLIYDAMEHFDISRQELVSKETLANHLADAEYLYDVHNYPAAKTHASWVLKFDSENEGARRIAGLCSFNLGEYNKALCYLNELKYPDEDSKKALMLSQAFAAQEQGEHLCQIDAFDSLEEND